MSEEQIISKKQVIVAVAAAAMGGIAPNLIGLGIRLTTMGEELCGLPEGTFYVGLLIFAVMGGAVGFFWQEIDPRKAFYLGIALPALIQVGGYNAQGQLREDPPADVAPNDGDTCSIPFSMTSEAIAQGPMIKSATSAIHGRKMLIEIDQRFFIQKLIRDQLTLWYYYYNQSNPERILIPILSTFTNEAKRDEGTSNRAFQLQLDIPKTARACLIQVKTQYSKSVTLSTTPNSTQLYELRYTKSKWSGLKQAFGQRFVSKYQVQFHVVCSGPSIRFDSRAEFSETRGKYNWFRWETFVDATKAQLDDIAEVEYKLHRTFSPESPARDRSTWFAISRDGWGSFWVHAIISHSNSKRKTHIQYYLDLRKGR